MGVSERGAVRSLNRRLKRTIVKNASPIHGTAVLVLSPGRLVWRVHWIT